MLYFSDLGTSDFDELVRLLTDVVRAVYCPMSYEPCVVRCWTGWLTGNHWPTGGWMERDPWDSALTTYTARENHTHHRKLVSLSGCKPEPFRNSFGKKRRKIPDDSLSQFYWDWWRKLYVMDVAGMQRESNLDPWIRPLRACDMPHGHPSQ